MPPKIEALKILTGNGEKILIELKRQGISNVAELTDQLSRLVPVSELNGIQEQLGGERGVKDVAKIVEAVGGHQQAITLLQKYGVGKPHCLPLTNSVGRLTGVTPLSTMTAYDDKIVIETETPELKELLHSLGLPFEKVKSLPIAEFKVAFKDVPSKVNACVHTVIFREVTRLVDARDAVRPFFRLNIQKVAQ